MIPTIIHQNLLIYRLWSPPIGPLFQCINSGNYDNIVFMVKRKQKQKDVGPASRLEGPLYPIRGTTYSTSVIE